LTHPWSQDLDNLPRVSGVETMTAPKQNLSSTASPVNPNHSHSTVSFLNQAISIFLTLGKDAFQSLTIDLPALTLGHWFGSIPGVEGVFWTPGTLNENAPQLTGRDAQIGKGLTSEHIGSQPYLFAEIDDCDFKEQIKRIEKAIKAGLPAPTMAISSGNKSIHWYWLLNQAYLPTESSEKSKVQIRFGKWSEYQARLAGIIGGDHCLTDAIRKMRLPVGKLPNGRNQALVYYNNGAVNREELEKAIDSLFSALKKEEQDQYLERVSRKNFGRSAERVEVDHDGSDWNQRLGGRKKRAVRCPSPDHDDRNPSAFISQNDDGVPYLHCSKCGKTFWPKSEKKFGHSHRFGNNEQVRKEKPQWERFSCVRYLDEELVQGKYLPHYTLKDCIRILGFDSTMGTGKTEAISNVIKDIDSDYTILAIVHRRSLADSLAKRFNLISYLDIPIEQNTEITGDVVITPDSIHKLDVNMYLKDNLIVIVDEATQVLQHLTNGPANHSTKLNAFDLSRKLFAHASKIFVADAFLNHRFADWIQEITNTQNNEIEIRGAKTRTWPHNYYVSFDARSWHDDLLKHVRENKKIGIPTMSLNHAGVTKELILNIYPDTKILLITPETRETPEVLSAFADKTMNDYQVVIYTPTLSTGISITKDIFEPDLVYAWVCANSGTAQDAMQQMHRIRSIKSNNIYIHVDGRGKTNLETDSEKIFSSGVHLKREIADDRNYRTPRTTAEQTLEREYSYLHAQTLSEIRLNGGDGACIKWPFLRLLEREIPKAQLYIDNEKVTKEKRKESENKAKREERDRKKEARQAYRLSEICRVIESEDLSKLEADDPNSDKYARIKYTCKKLTGGKLDETVIYELLFDRLGEQVNNLSALLCHVLKIEHEQAPLVADLRQLHEEVPSAHFRFNTEAARLIIEQLTAFGIDPRQLFAENYTPTLLKPEESAKKLHELYEQPNYPDRMSRALGSKPDSSYLQMPNRTLTNTLGRLGIETTSTRQGKDENGKRQRVYQLDEDSRALMMGYAIRNLGLTASEVQRLLADLSSVEDPTLGSGRDAKQGSESVNSSQGSKGNGDEKMLKVSLNDNVSFFGASVEAGEEWFEKMERVYCETMGEVVQRE